MALESELRRPGEAVPLRDRLRPLQGRILARPATRQDVLRRAQRRGLMFVDALGIVAILTREPEADKLADRLEQAPDPITSPIAVFEAVAGLCRRCHASVEETQADRREFLETARIRLVAITAEDGEAALLAFRHYGKGRGHPARLNMGDGFAYAVARTHGAPLLFKGEDVGQTDIRSATDVR